MSAEEDAYARGRRYGEAQAAAKVARVANNMTDFAADVWDKAIDAAHGAGLPYAETIILKSQNPHRRQMPDTIEGMFG